MLRSPASAEFTRCADHLGRRTPVPASNSSSNNSSSIHTTRSAMLSGQSKLGTKPAGVAPARKERGPRVVQAKPAYLVSPPYGWLNDP